MMLLGFIHSGRSSKRKHRRKTGSRKFHSQPYPPNKNNKVNLETTRHIISYHYLTMDSAAENTVPTIQAMRRQEETAYSCIDYLHQQQLPQMRDPSNEPLSSGYAVTPICREKMVQWCYKVCSNVMLSHLSSSRRRQIPARKEIREKGTNVSSIYVLFSPC